MPKQVCNSVIPMEEASRVAVVWKNLTVYKPMDFLDGCIIRSMSRKCRKAILRNISGVFRFQDLSAIMGPSGAGKTTLLQCLFGTWTGQYRGKIYHNPMANKASFITQREEDHLFPCLSVIESIFYASRLKGSTADSRVVQELIDQLDLRGCQNTLVNSCSGGQRKRLVIAQELAADVKPKILFIDEPTSGLDSNVSFTVLAQLRKLCITHGMAIIATIHQPSYKILKLFDHLYVLSRSGRCLYQGLPEVLRSNLAEFQINCPNGHNPADVIIDAAAISTVRSSMDDGEGTTECFYFSKSKRPKELAISMTNNMDEKELLKVHLLEESSAKRIECEMDSIDTNSMSEVEYMRENRNHLNLRHMMYLLRRSFLHGTCREPLWLFIRVGLHLFVALLLSMLYDNDIGLSDGCLWVNDKGYYHNPNCSDRISLTTLREESNIDRNIPFLFFNLLFLMFASLMPTVLTFPSEIKIFMNEHRNGWYSTASYYFAKTLTEFWIQLILPYLYCLFTFWSTQQIGLSTWQDAIPLISSTSRFKNFVAISILASFIAQGIGFMIGSIFATNFNISIFVATVIMLFNFLFSGFFVRSNSMGKAQFITYLSFIRFAFEAILLTVYGQDRCSLAVNKSTSTTTTTTLSPLLSSSPSSAFLGATSTRSPKNEFNRITSVVMYKFELHDEDYSQHFTALLIHLFLWRLLTFLILYFKVNPDSCSRISFPSNLGKKLISAKCCLYFSSIIIVISLAFIIFSVYVLITG
ncbi:ATP-binding cassette sub-family G member 1-like [Brevipalpus obovatus]|uniref:ATP-binding cassette sub-family G member 1-like n=1 Tax=Brevipalpus obovatus TaxID=246614 RepID=UPI003D9E6871